MIPETQDSSRVRQIDSAAQPCPPDAGMPVMRWQPMARILPAALFIDAMLAYLAWVIWEMMP